MLSDISTFFACLAPFGFICSINNLMCPRKVMPSSLPSSYPSVHYIESRAIPFLGRLRKVISQPALFISESSIAAPFYPQCRPFPTIRIYRPGQSDTKPFLLPPLCHPGVKHINVKHSVFPFIATPRDHPFYMAMCIHNGERYISTGYTIFTDSRFQ